MYFLRNEIKGSNGLSTTNDKPYSQDGLMYMYFRDTSNGQVGLLDATSHTHFLKKFYLRKVDTDTRVGAILRNRGASTY